MLLSAVSGYAQQRVPQNLRLGALGERDEGSHWNEVESDSVEKEGVPIGMYTWKIEPMYPTFSRSFLGFKLTDSESTAFSSLPRITCSATKTSDVGEYPIVV